ncbi:MAG: hypothetical protein IPL84_00675 [Chitinophagaceae bacterium]|nr:hypothetical protein [Chitinophagaceae bacterium]
MKKITIILCSLFVLSGCGGNAEKATTQVIEEQKNVSTDKDQELQDWLKGKIWTAEESMAPMEILKLQSDGVFLLKNESKPGKWKILKGELALSGLTEWPLEKLAEKTFRLYVSPTKTWFMYKHSGDL